MFKTISDVRAANRAIDNHFFDAKTMRFFASKVESSLYAGKYFITSEKQGFEGGSRRYTIREALPTGEVRTHSDFNKFRSIESARDAVRELVRNEKFAEVANETSTNA